MSMSYDPKLLQHALSGDPVACASLTEQLELEGEQMGLGWSALAATGKRCQMCLEPGEVVNGVFIHAFTEKPQCTYRSHL